MLARQINRSLNKPLNYDVVGGNARDIQSNNDDILYKGPEWFTKSANSDIYLGLYKE